MTPWDHYEKAESLIESAINSNRKGYPKRAEFEMRLAELHIGLAHTPPGTWNYVKMNKYLQGAGATTPPTPMRMDTGGYVDPFGVNHSDPFGNE